MPVADLELRERIGRRMRALRRARGWSLDQLVRRSGVSKGVLVQIEGAQGNPSLATLVRLSDAFGTTVAQLIEGVPEGDGIRVGRAGAGTVLWRGERESSATLLVSDDAQGHVELWEWRLGSGVEYRSEAHVDGTAELVQVRRGRLRLTVGAAMETLGPGDAARYHADTPHAYGAPGRGAVVFTMVVVVPGV